MASFLSYRVRRQPTPEPAVYLTFDDGPDPQLTPVILDILKRHGAKGTFFVITERARQQSELIQRILQEGHAIGDHSWDHRYRNYFVSRSQLEAWIEKGRRGLEDLIGPRSVGFRSPAGVVTPKLVKVLRDKNIPLILWNRRFFDTAYRFTAEKAKRAAQQIAPGDILLLHDGNNRDAATFTAGLERLLETGKARGLRFERLSPYTST